MIINNAGSRCDIGFWTKHLQSTEENERAELKQIRGLNATNLQDALLEMQEEAAILPRLKNFMYHADFNPREHERFTEQEWERTFEIFEKERGIPTGTPRIVYEHEKQGRVHRHVIWTRLDPENMRAFPDGLDAKVAHAAARKIEIELGLEKVIGPFDREPGTARPPRAPEAWEMYRAMKTGIDPRDITAEVTELFKQSQNGKEFQAALELHGYELVTGKRGLLILDSAGKEHSLAKRIDGIKTAELNAFMRDVDRAALPTLEQAKEQYQERKIAGLEADRATVHAEIRWEEALAKAAIEKEKIAREFAEPEVRETRFDAAATHIPERIELLVASLSDRYFNDLYAYQQEMPVLYEMAPDIAQEVESRVTNANRELIDKHFGPVDYAELSRSIWQDDKHQHEIFPPLPETVMQNVRDHRGIEWEKEQARRREEWEKKLARIDQRPLNTSRRAVPPKLREGDYVAVTDDARIYNLNYRTTGDSAEQVQKFMATLDRKEFQSVAAVLKTVHERAELRDIERQAFRDLSAGDMRREKDTRPTGRLPRPALTGKSAASNIKHGLHKSATAIEKTASIAASFGRVLDVIGSMVDSLAAPTLTPQQIHDGEKAKDRREAEAETTIDFSRYTAETAQQRQQQDNEREAARQRQRDDGGGRER